MRKLFCGPLYTRYVRLPYPDAENHLRRKQPENVYDQSCAQALFPCKYKDFELRTIKLPRASNLVDRSRNGGKTSRINEQKHTHY